MIKLCWCEVSVIVCVHVVSCCEACCLLLTRRMSADGVSSCNGLVLFLGLFVLFCFFSQCWWAFRPTFSTAPRSINGRMGEGLSFNQETKATPGWLQPSPKLSLWLFLRVDFHAGLQHTKAHNTHLWKDRNANKGEDFHKHRDCNQDLSLFIHTEKRSAAPQCYFRCQSLVWCFYMLNCPHNVSSTLSLLLTAARSCHPNATASSHRRSLRRSFCHHGGICDVHTDNQA